MLQHKSCGLARRDSRKKLNERAEFDAPLKSPLPFREVTSAALLKSTVLSRWLFLIYAKKCAEFTEHSLAYDCILVYSIYVVEYLTNGCCYYIGGTDMKKILKASLTLVMVVMLLLSMVVGAYADLELPTETVWYGCGHPDAAPVPMHGLTAENITIDGVDIELFSSNGYVYIRLVDLAAAKLLRESADKMAELGLTAERLYIKEGLILVKADGLTADELSALMEKVNELTNGAQIAASVGDVFTLGNGGSAVLYVEIGGFAFDPEQVEPTEPTEPTEPAVPVFDVNKGVLYARASSKPVAQVNDRPELTTLYITYGYTPIYGVGGADIGDEVINRDVYGGIKADTPEQDFSKSISASYIYLVKADGDNENYYYSTDGQTYTLLDDAGTDCTAFVLIFDERTGYKGTSETRNVEEVRSALKTTITISTTGDSSGIIKTIKYDDATLEYFYYDENYSYESNGKTEVGNYVVDSSKFPTRGDPNTWPDDEEYTAIVDNNNAQTIFEPKNPLVIVSDQDGKTTAEASSVTAQINNGITIV